MEYIRKKVMTHLIITQCCHFAQAKHKISLAAHTVGKRNVGGRDIESARQRLFAVGGDVGARKRRNRHFVARQAKPIVENLISLAQALRQLHAARTSSGNWVLAFVCASSSFRSFRRLLCAFSLLGFFALGAFRQLALGDGGEVSLCRHRFRSATSHRRFKRTTNKKKITKDEG